MGKQEFYGCLGNVARQIVRAQIAATARARWRECASRFALYVLQQLL